MIKEGNPVPIQNNFRKAYPDELQAAEKEMVALRHGEEAARPTIGFGLSGGGIRSATFSLGVFQTLARLMLLPKIDYLSSVSGGGYFASFYGRLFSREDVTGFADIYRILAIDTPSGPDSVAESEALTSATNSPPLWQSKVFRWLRENGRYLSPKGAGDLLLDLAAVFRNMIAIQIVIVTPIFTIFLLSQLIRGWFPSLDNTVGCLPLAQHIWWSPWIWVPVVGALVLIAPFGWAYWMVERNTRSRENPTGYKQIPPWVGLAFTLICAVGIAVAKGFHGTTALIGLVVLGVGILTWICWQVSSYLARRDASANPQDRDTINYVAAAARTWLTRQLSIAMAITAALTAFAVIDSMGQSLYYLMIEPSTHVKRYLVPLTGGLTMLAPFVKMFVVDLAPKSSGTRLRVSVNLIALMVALIVAGAVLVGVDAATNAIAWNFQRPAWCPATVEAPHRAMRMLGLSSVIGLVFCYLFGNTWTFLNRSSHQGMYSARLTRAYLGASNSARHKPGQQAADSISDVMLGDDIEQRRYWPAIDGAPYEKGAPLHLVNVTINETVSGKSQIEQRDRKGLAMALGPAALSAGVTSHLLFRGGSGANRYDYDKVKVLPSSGSAFEHSANSGKMVAERLPLGQWTGISGAAFSTGLGARTSLGISLLAGFFNVRLGYWWKAIPDTAAPEPTPTPARRRCFSSLRDGFISVFPVHAMLMGEMLSRFHGTAKRTWYLSDGGHFESLAGYELIRRRLPLIVLVDAEEDQEYNFDGLANLVRKARLDFGAEIRFLSKTELDEAVEPTLRPWFGTLDQLRRGTWNEGPVPEPIGGRNRLSMSMVNLDQLSLAHAALAKVHYQDSEVDSPPSTLLYIKPTLTGDEPTDVRRYHIEHPDFPHESTAKQFFDEAQWESYRRLGVHISSKLFSKVEASSDWFSPNAMRPLP